MDYLVIAVMGFIGGGIVVFVALDAKRRKLDQQRRDQAAHAAQLEQTRDAMNARYDELNRESARLNTEADSRQTALFQQAAQLKTERDQFQSTVISYSELRDENAILKRDLRNLDIETRKLRLDGQLRAQTQDATDQRVKELGSRYLKENVKWVGASLNQNNFAACKQRLQDVIERCRRIGFDVSVAEEAELIANLRVDYEKVVRAAFEREEQARIRAQIREEQLRDREIKKEQERLDRERTAIQAALERALAEATDQHSAEIERLRAKLAEAEEKQRAISQAQLTKAGYVYVISNVGSFGDGVFKIGMTRRLEPMDRVKELGDASVPFPFDVHMMLSCENAPALENALHRTLHKVRINKTNPRKEFFKTKIDTIYRVVKENHGEVEYVADAEALQYQQSLTMTTEDQEFIETVFDDLEEDNQTVTDDM
jgi:Meiotically up-regulated gene 113